MSIHIYAEKYIWHQLEHINLLCGYISALFKTFMVDTKDIHSVDLNFLAQGNLLEIGGFIFSRKIVHPEKQLV